MFAIEEELWFGDSADDASEANAARSMAAMGGRILGAKPFPIAAKRLAELTRNPSSRIDQVVRVLEGDPALSARLLRLVNSAGYALRVRCTSVRHAAALVGVGRLHQLATTAAILDMFDANSKHSIALLGHAAVVGSLCRYLAVHLALPPDELFTCGFLHDIGKLMLLDSEGDRYPTLLTQYGDMPDQIHRYEREVFGFDHAVLGAHVLSAWNIPEPVPRVVAWHHNTPRAYKAGGSIVSMVQTLRLADELSYSLGIESVDDAVAATAAGDAAGYLDISEPQLARMWDDLRSLRERALSHGAGDDAEIVPREVPIARSFPSLRPRESTRPDEAESPSEPAESQIIRTAAAPAPRAEVSAVPQHFPCLVCQKASFGSRCSLCSGHVCPEHVVGPEDWCALCAREYLLARETARTSPTVKLTLGVLIGVSVIAAVLGAALAPEVSWVSVVVGPLLLLALWVVLLAVGARIWVSYHFRRARAARRLPKTEPRPLPKQPVMAWPAPRITAIDVDAPTDPPPASLVDPLGATNRPPAPSSTSADLFVLAANRTRDMASILDLDSEFALAHAENDQQRNLPEPTPAAEPERAAATSATATAPNPRPNDDSNASSASLIAAEAPPATQAAPTLDTRRRAAEAKPAANAEPASQRAATAEETPNATKSPASQQTPAAKASEATASKLPSQETASAPAAPLAAEATETVESSAAPESEPSTSPEPAPHAARADLDAPADLSAAAEPAVESSLAVVESSSAAVESSLPAEAAIEHAAVSEASNTEPVGTEASSDALPASGSASRDAANSASDTASAAADAAVEAELTRDANADAQLDVAESAAWPDSSRELSVEAASDAAAAPSNGPDSDMRVSETEPEPALDSDANVELAAAVPALLIAAKPTGLAALAVQRRPPVASTARLFG